MTLDTDDILASMEVYSNAIAPVYCDMGPHEGLTRIDLVVSVYLTSSELDSFMIHGITVGLVPDPTPQESTNDGNKEQGTLP